MPGTSNATLPFLGLGDEHALHALADAMPHGVFTTDLDGRVTYWNAAAERITGWTREEALGKDCSILAGDAVNGCSCGAGPLRCGLASLGKTSKCCSAVARNGSLLLIVKNAAPLYAASGEIVGAIESFTDVTAFASSHVRAQAVRPTCGDFQGLVGRDPGMQELYRTVGLVAGSDATVLILGESGTGKERVAEAIHALSARSAGPFVRVSCSALNENLLESELFGHVKGAFTGALRDRRGRFHEAHGGTLLLDEIGDISPVVQLKLLRVLEWRHVERVGDSASTPVDVRLVCATHRDLKALVRAGQFRADLYFRISVFPVRVPPLREHLSDLPALAEHALSRVHHRGARASVGPEVLAALAAYPWPGNVRELQNVLEFASLRAGDRPISLSDLPAELRDGAGLAHGGPREAPGLPAARRGGRDLDRDALIAALEATGGNRAAAARRLGISRVTLWKKLKALGIDSPET